MALFKVITEEESGNAKLYKEPKDLEQLIHYVCSKSVHFYTYNLFPLDVDGVIGQMLYLQSCRGKGLHTRALHFVLSYDTGGWEWQMDQEKVYESIRAVRIAAEAMNVRGYQWCAGVHDIKAHRHIHFILNPVNVVTKNVLHYHMGQYRAFLRELAYWLYADFKIALSGIDYIAEDGRMRYVGERVPDPFLYENRRYSYEPFQ